MLMICWNIQQPASWSPVLDAHDFKNRRLLAAWLGLTTPQYSSGGKKAWRITKAGDSYLRTFLVQGARSVLIGADKSVSSPHNRAIHI